MITQLKLALLLPLLALPASAFSAVPPAGGIIVSPVVLADYAAWMRDSDAFAHGPETRAFRDVVEILYDGEIGREWKDYFSDAEDRLETLRTLVCPALAATPLCALPRKIATEADLKILAAALADPATLAALSARWSLAIEPVRFPNSPRPFDLLAAKSAPAEIAQVQYWDLSGSVERRLFTPVLHDTDTYQAGFQSGAVFAGQFAFAEGKVIFNDWQIRDRVMKFAARWKRAIGLNRDAAPADSIVDGERILFQKLYDENLPAFARYYAELLPKAAESEDTHTRFLQERAAGDYPEEVYQWAAYRPLADLLRVQTAYFDLAARGGRTGVSDRQQALESLLTLQRYGTSLPALLLELSFLAQPLTGHAYLLDETIAPGLSLTFLREQLLAILGQDAYLGRNLFPRMKYALVDQALFSPYYLQNFRPDIYERLKRPDGTITPVASLTEEEQRHLLASYLVQPGGKPDPVATFRLALAFCVHIRAGDAQELATLIHETRFPAPKQ